MKNKFYITTPIYYVNASPHIGHSYTTIAADTLARFYRRVLGEGNVWFLTGTDEHGQKIQKAALAQGMSPQEFTDRVSVQFKDLWGKLGISYDDFIRTTQSRHTDFVRQALTKLKHIGDIYEAPYEGWYCQPCETFWMEGQISNSACPDCHRPVEKISETNFFFKLRQHQGWLIQHIKDHADFIRPEVRRNEVLSFLTQNELIDLCISRPKERLNWGIEMPFSPGHVTYVWFDALVNYISAVGTFDASGAYASPWWGDDCLTVHLIGKDILRQHAVYWPIMLHALGVRPPDSICAHGWWLIDDTKMSKSLGNVVAPLAMVDTYGIDVYRYFLLRDVPFGLDGNFSEEAIIKRYNADLANDLGNLVYRTLTMVEKYYQGVVPSGAPARDERGKRIEEKLAGIDTEVAGYLAPQADFNFSAALSTAWALVNMANKYIEETKPWNLAKENKPDELKAFISLLVEVIRGVAVIIAPFVPQTARQIHEQIGAGCIQKGKPLFPRIDVKPVT
jgi:methionyl-tRNA synthetase